MAEEIELKLDLTQAAADALEAADLWPGDPKITKLWSTYFDTPDHALSKVGLSLRIRRTGRKRVQTVKSNRASTGGLFVRSEWERAVTKNKPILDETTPIRAVLGDAADLISPVFEVRIERRSWIIHEVGATIELALDRGEAVADEQRSQICEVELELKAGNPASLFALARRIDAVVPLRLGVQSKAERGYRLSAPTAAMVKVEPIALTEDLTAAEALRHFVQSCVRQFRMNEAVLVARRDAGALHQSRVAVRRLRSAFSTFKSVIDGAVQRALRDELLWLASELGDARNLDVLLVRTHTGQLQDRIVAAREAAYDRVVEMLESARVRTLMLDLAEWTAVGEWLSDSDTGATRRQSARAFAVTALERLQRKVKKESRNLVRADDKARHEVRKDAKKLRYASEGFASLFRHNRQRRRQRKFFAALEALQDRLGALNDLAATPQVLTKLGLMDDPDAAPLLAGGERKALLEAAVEAHEDLIDVKQFWR